MTDSHAHGPQAGGHDHDLLTHRRGVRAVWVSAVGLGLTALFQFVIVAFSGSAALLADGLHNIGDVAGTASLWIAFSLSRRAASDQYSYGWRRAEDLAGLVIVLAIAASALLAGWDSVAALLASGHQVRHPAWAFAAALVGIVGNEGVAQYKVRVGRQINSVPLIADGQHARTDGLASAAAAAGVAGAWLGLPILDPLAGLVITAGIAWILVTVGRDVLRRNMDAIEPGLLPRLREVAGGVAGVHDVHDVRARYAGRGLLVQLHADVDGALPLRDAHGIAEEVRHALAHAVPGVWHVDVHLDPAGDDGAHEATAHHFGARHKGSARS